MTRNHRAHVRKKARLQMVRRHRQRYQELYQEFLSTGIARGTAQDRAQAALAAEFRPEYERIHRGEVEKLSRELIANTPIEAIDEDFKANPARGCAPERGRSLLFVSDVLGERRKAKKICETCPVRQACEDFATVNDEQHHVWGGVDRGSASERRQAGLRFSARANRLVSA